MEGTFRKKRRIKTIIIVSVLTILAITYVAIYMYLRSKEVKPDIRYYDMGTVVECGGYEFTASAKMYTKEELMKKFDIKDYEMPDDGGSERIYIVVDKGIKRISEEVSDKIDYDYALTIYSKYWQVGYDSMLTDEIQKDDYIYISSLEIGQVTSMYGVYFVSKDLLSDKLWNAIEETEVYYEYPGDRNHQYVSRVKIIN